jgi:arsenite-transporting ATPase
VRVLLHTGKGGVGKTTLALATAFGAARHGHSVFVLSADPAHNLGDALGRRVGSAPVRVAERVVVQEVGVLDELDRAWSEIQEYLRQLLRSEADEMVAEELLVFPGMEELVSLRAVREVEASGEFDTCVVDCAPTGGTLRLLRLPDVLRIFMERLFEESRGSARILRPLLDRVRAGSLVPSEALFESFERLYREVEDVRQILLDEERTSARLVVNPSKVVLAEARRSFAYLSLYGVTTDAVIVNRVLPEEAAGGYFARWAERERSALEEIERSFPVPRFRVPLYPRELHGPAALAALAEEVFGDRDPAARFGRARPIRLHKRGARTVLAVDLPGVAKEEIEVSAAGSELFVRARDASRSIALPASLAGRRVEEARLEGGVLEVSFEA